MGLKTIVFAGYKNGKTVFALSAAEIGPVGYIDNEFHARPYLVESEEKSPFEFAKVFHTYADLPMCKDNPAIGKAFATRNPVYLCETQELDLTFVALRAFAASPEIATIVVDSGSIVWDLIGDMADEAHEESIQKNIDKGRGDVSTVGRLAWNKPKKYNRRLFYTQMRSGKHIINTAHVQEEYKDNKPTGRIQPWLEKKSPHWADLVIEIALPAAKLDMATGKTIPAKPSILVVGDNLGGRGGITRGKHIENATFKALVDATGLFPTAQTQVDPEEALHRNRGAVDRVAAMSTGLTEQQESHNTYPHGR